MLSKMCQHVDSSVLVFDKGALCKFTSLQTKAFPPKQAYVDISVFGWLRKQRSRFTGDKPKCCFHMKELGRTTEAIARVNAR